MSSSNQPNKPDLFSLSPSDGERAGVRGWSRYALALLILSVLGVTLFLATRHRPSSIAPPEVHRKDLEMRAGVWYAPGQTNGFNGLLFDTYDDGAIKSRSVVSNGLLHGLSQGWYTNGQQQVQEHFVAGTSHGVRIKWHPNGQKLSEVSIVNGKLHGTFRRWHENGERAEEVVLSEGQPDGISTAYFPSGCLKSQVTMRKGEVLAQQFWQDGEYRQSTTSDQFSSK